MKYAGIYIHIPFCIKKCHYCNFYSITNFSYTENFCNALKKEICFNKDKNFICDSIYFGGGTPTSLKPAYLVDILYTVFENFTIIPDSEITIETNPFTIKKNELLLLKKAGFNRINIGIQSFSDSNLKFLGRIHNSKQAIDAYDTARKSGFENIGIDLIYGIPGQTLKMWFKDIKKACAINPEHISCYMLTFEPKTKIYKDLEAGIYKKPNDEILRTFFLSTIEKLKNAGYMQYEVSNFAKKGFESRHNSKYWFGNIYKGFGPAAHSFDKTHRYWNISDVKEYILKTGNNKSPIQEKETLSKTQKITEAVYLGFRTIQGIDIKNFNTKFKTDFLKNYNQIILDLKKRNLLELKDGFCYLTPEGVILLDSVVGKFLKNEDYL
jgi:putative oxygen-independent coproporphyrinogen III oxidase